ncbi:Transcriptional activator HAP2 [Astathelohania contejeani]|uniref:Transcriptional activator HAP2 n=1 Tax=Astathelohania contejeani TaxID=164912 RepID=A0ABQ7HYN7_9MICR|nr:Transcriptional activator HAP2 [Thelohania contejeani]
MDKKKQMPFKGFSFGLLGDPSDNTMANDDSINHNIAPMWDLYQANEYGAFSPEERHAYDASEQKLFVNSKQYACIKKRKFRRDFLDSLMLAQNRGGYLHESRHRHAMNRLRAPSGRFLTKEEAEKLKGKKIYK